jgi:hypothetical protein
MPSGISRCILGDSVCAAMNIEARRGGDVGARMLLERIDGLTAKAMTEDCCFEPLIKRKPDYA